MLDLPLLLQKLNAYKTQINTQQTDAPPVWQALVTQKLADLMFQAQLKGLAARLELPMWQAVFGQHDLLAPAAIPYSVLAIDGSQIMPDRHSLTADIALIQISGVLLEYGAQVSHTRYFSHVELVLAQDFYGLAFDAKLVEQLRDLLEFECAVRWAQELYAQPLILLDGSLSFLLEQFGNVTKIVSPGFAQRFFAALKTIAQTSSRLVFYTSRPSSKQFSGLFKIVTCQAPYFDKPICVGGCKQRSCMELSKVNDAQFFESLLPPQSISQIFCFDVAETHCYSWFLNSNQLAQSDTGEIAKLEMPIKSDINTAELFAQIFDQTCKGFGYPVALALAHHNAMISALEQKIFTQALQHFCLTRDPKLSKKLQSKAFLGF